MPLPVGGTGKNDTRWPPDDKFDTYGKYQEHSAWYGGDVQELAAVYTGMNGPNAKPKGLVNSVRGWFWGKEALAPAPRPRIHVPMAADIATVGADMLFSVSPTFKIQDEEANEKIQDRLEEIVEEENFKRSILECAEVSGALGGVFLRMTWDEVLAPKRPLLTAVHPDSAVADFRWGRLVGVTFWHVIKEGDGVCYRHLERHERGMIYHGLFKGTVDRFGGYYRGSAGMLGTRVPLTDLPETASLVDGLDGPDFIATGITRMTAVYVPNMLPNRLHRGSDLGRSDYQGSEGLMDALDEVYTSWMRDIQLGKGRIIVPAEFLRSVTGAKGQGAWFDAQQEIFVPLPGMNPATDASLTISQFAIRTKEHQDTAMALIERIVAAAGYSASSFGMLGDVQAQTATEIESRERRSFITRSKKAQYWGPGLRDILMAALEFDQKHFSGPGVAKIVVKFGTPVQEDMLKRASSIEALARAGAASIARLVKMSDDSLTDDQVTAEVALIQKEKGMMIPNSTAPMPKVGIDPGNTSAK